MLKSFQSTRWSRWSQILAALALGCSPKLSGPTPQTESVAPNVVCVEQLTTRVTVLGARFSPLPTGSLVARSQLALPQVALHQSTDIAGQPAQSTIALPDNSASPESSYTSWTSSGEMAFRIDPALALSPGLFDVEVTNRNGSSDTLETALLAVPRPTLSAIEPDLLCGDKSNAFVLRGDFFLEIAAAVPSVAIGAGASRREYLPTLSDCRTLPGSSATRACRELRITIAEGDLSAGSYPVVVTNPAPANCVSSDVQALTIVPRPSVLAIDPEFACLADGSVRVAIRGTGFLVVDGVQPTVRFGDVAVSGQTDPTSCETVGVMREVVTSCTRMTATLPISALGPGSHNVTVVNPAPADCVSSESIPYRVLPPPTVSQVIPSAVCSEGAGSQAVRIDGSGFAVVGSNSPILHVGSMSFATQAVPQSCSTTQGLQSSVQICTALTANIPRAALGTGAYPIAIENPAPIGCRSRDVRELRFIARPTIAGIAPSRMCSGGGTLTITGTNFASGATVALGDTLADSSVVVSGTLLTAHFSSGLRVGGPYDLHVSNAASCDATATAAVEIIPGPQIFFADPPVLYSGIRTQVLLYVTGITDVVAMVAIRPTGSTAPRTIVPSSWSATRPGRVQITIPAGMAPGEYDVMLEDNTSCGAELARGLRITDTLNGSLASIEPPYAWTNSSTAVTLSTANPLRVGEVGFSSVPRFYLNPVSATATSVATPLTAVTALSAERATAIAPSGLPAGDYDVIVVNSDGSVGALPNAFHVTALAPPLVDTLSPGSLVNSATAQFEVRGRNFRNANVRLRCRAPASTSVVELDPTETNGSATSVTATVNASSLSAGTVCVVRATNSDGSYGDFSVLSWTNSSQNISMPRNGPVLNAARRGPSSVGGDATSAARFVYTLGGDNGSAAGTLDSVESLPVDAFGSPAAYATQRNRLLSPRAFAGAVRIGRFVYIAGGTNGIAPLATVERAYILDPADRPEINDVELRIEDSGGMVTGLYYYQVAAVLAANHPTNPSGETLASERYPVSIPALTGRSTQVRLSWTAFANATAYRIYRSPSPNSAAGAERMVAEVPASSTTWTDTNLAASGGAALPLGALGVFHAAGSLSTARSDPAVTTLVDPTLASRSYFYVAGGRSTTANLSSIEIFTVDTAANGAQTISASRLAAVSLAVARWQLAAYAATSGVASRIMSAQPYLYFAGGTVDAAGGTAVQDVQAFPLAGAGDLGSGIVVDNIQARAGFAGVAANNFLYSFGGSNGGASTSIISAELCGADRACPAGPPDPPDLVNWNSAGVSLNEARVFLGVAVLPGFIYLSGGSNGSNALASTEWTSW